MRNHKLLKFSIPSLFTTLKFDPLKLLQSTQAILKSHNSEPSWWHLRRGGNAFWWDASKFFSFLSSFVFLLLKSSHVCLFIATSSDFSSELDEEWVTSSFVSCNYKRVTREGLYRVKMFIFVVIGNFFDIFWDFYGWKEKQRRIFLKTLEKFSWQKKKLIRSVKNLNLFW